MRRALQTLGRALLWCVIGTIALAASAVAHLGLPIARRVASGVLGDLVTQQIRGALVVTSLAEMSLGRVVTGKVMLFDAKGRLIIEAKQLVLVPDLAALRAYRVRFASARLDGAMVHLFDEGEGLPSLLTTFDSRTPGPSTGSEPLRVVIDGITLARATVDGDLLGLRSFRATNLNAHGRLEIARDVRVRINSASASMVEPFGFTGYVDALSGTISTLSTEGIDLRARTHRDGEQASAHIRFAANRIGAENILSIDLVGERLAVNTLRGLSFDFLPDLAVPVSGKLKLRGPPTDLSIQAWLKTDAGNAVLDGTITRTRGTSITMRTESMRLSHLLTKFPTATARGSLRIDAAPDDSRPRLHAVVEPLLYDWLAVPGFELDGTLTDDGLRIDSVNATSRGARIEGHGHIHSDGSVDLVAHAHFSEISHDKNLHRLLPDARGALDAELHVQSVNVEHASFTLEGRLVLSNASYGMLSAKRLEMQGSARGDPEHPKLNVKVRGTAVRFGEYLLGDPSLTLRGGPREYHAEGQFVSAGKRTFNLSAKIAAQPRGFMIDADPIEFTVGDGSWRGALKGLHIMPDEAVKLGLLRLASRSQRLEARGELRFHGDDQLDAQLQDFDLAAVNALLGDRFLLKQGRADAHVELSGDISRPELRIQGALREGVVKGLKDVGALYFVTYQTGQLEVDGEVDLGSRGLLRANGRGRLDPAIGDPAQALRLGNYDVTVTADALALSLLPAEKRADALGSLNAALHLTGTVSNPSIQGRVEIATLTVPGVSPLTVSADGGYASGALDAQLRISDAQGPLLHADARTQLALPALAENPELLSQALARGPWQVTGQTVRRRVDQMPLPLSALLPYPAALETKFSIEKRDGVTHGGIDFDSTWERALGSECGGEMHPRAAGRLTLDRGVSHVEASIRTDRSEVGTISISLETPVDRWVEQGHFEPLSGFRARSKFDIEAIENFPYLCEYGSGSLNAELELDGGRTVEPLLVMTVDSSFLPRVVRREGRRKVPVRSCEGDPMRVHLDLNADSEYASSSGRVEGCKGGATILTGRLPVQWQSLLFLPVLRDDGDLQVLARFEGAQLKPLLDRIPGVRNADALARGEVSITGTVAHPRIGGNLEVNGGRLFLVATGEELTDIDAGLVFHGDWVKLEHFAAHQGKGRITSTGGLAFAGLTPRRARIAVQLSKLPITREGLETAWLTGSAVVDAEIREDRLRAAIKLHALDVRLPDTINRTLQPLDRHPDVVIVTELPEPISDPYPIELVIDGKRGLTVKRNDFNATVSAELAATYRDPDLSLAGYIRFLDGEFEVFGKRFDINNGGLRFDGTKELNPEVYLLATQKPDAAGASPVTLAVNGTLNEPVVTFTSDVCPGESGALTYLVSGQCASDSPDLAQESEDAQDAFNTGVLSGVLTLGAQGELSALSPRLKYESTAQGAQRYKAGISSESLIPTFMRSFVRRVYIQGGVSTPATDAPVATTPTGTEDTAAASLDFLLELYFAHNIVGAGRFGQQSWGLDVTWEP